MLSISNFQVESLGTTKKKKGRGGGGDNAEAIEEFQHHLEKHRDHVQKLETLLRMLDNDNVNIDQVKKLQTMSSQ